MTEDARTTMTDAFERNIFARPIGGESVLTVMGGAPGGRGPWSIVTGIPNPGGDMLGPLPQYLSVAAWAA
jgi:hypothetical protein